MGAADWLSFTNQNGFVLDQPASGPPPNLRISGKVDVLRTAVTGGDIGVVGISVTHTINMAPSVTIDAGAALHVTATFPGGVAIGYFANNTGGPALTNSGAMTVIADAAARGVVNIADSGVLNNSGQITVTSASAEAIGVRFDSGRQHLLNSGVITATGHGQVTGVDMGNFTGQVFINRGTIAAHDDSSATTSVGVRWGVGFQQRSSFVNDGRIEGDQALLVEVSYGAAADNLFTNNGVLAGAVWLGGGAAETLVNNGVITGAIRLIGAGSVYDGRLGSALGPITGSNNGGNALLGGVGAETMTGGLWNDTISGGAGDDVIDGGGGSNKLDGGSGLNTLSFASLSNGVQVDLAAGTAHVPNGDDTLTGFAQVVGSPWNDSLRAAPGSSVAGGAGADTIIGAANGADYLRGDDGNDSILGGSGFDDINGNMGRDTLRGGDGGDWVVGGKDDDVQFGDAGADVVWGNLGNDTLDGGDGNDQVRGGQGDDVVNGGADDDYVSGDRGNDTITGGSGADLFHGSQDAGIDKVLDFHLSEGDRVMLDPGTTYTVSQVGSDTVIDMGSGHQMILAGVQMSTLTPGWIFGA